VMAANITLRCNMSLRNVTSPDPATGLRDLLRKTTKSDEWAAKKTVSFKKECLRGVSA
jgi:hypothetical protein